jgi:hypothetical protein
VLTTQNLPSCATRIMPRRFNSLGSLEKKHCGEVRDLRQLGLKHFVTRVSNHPGTMAAPFCRANSAIGIIGLPLLFRRAGPSSHPQFRPWSTAAAN